MRVTATLVALVAAAASVAAAPVHLGRLPHKEVTHERVGRTIRVPMLVREDGSRGVATAEAVAGHGTAGLYGGIVQLGQFFVNLTIGGQNFITQLDTGSSTLAVPMAGCKVASPLGGPTQGDCTFADPPFQKTSRTRAVDCGSEQCLFEVRYLDGSGMEGHLYNDDIVLGGLKASMAPFGAINETSPHFEDDTDGILGAAYSSLNCFAQPAQGGKQACFPTVVDSLVKDGAMDNVFGICLDGAHGRWDLGELDQQYSEDEYQWAQLDSTNGFYESGLVGLTVGGKRINSNEAGTSIIADSGTTIVVIDSAAMDAVNRTIRDQRPPQYSEILAGGCVTMSDSEVAQWPTLEYELPGWSGGTVTVPLKPQSYLLSYQGARCFGIQGDETEGQHILGDVFMQAYYTAFDRAQKRLGFAPVKNCARVY